MQIKVFKVSPVSVVNKGNKTWNELTVTYEGKKGEMTKTLRSFEGDVFNKFSEYRASHPMYAKITVKKEGDYWQWKDVEFLEKEDVNVSGQPETQTAAREASGVKKNVGNWETAEERAAKQRYIVRQSSITSAINYLGSSSDKFTVYDVLQVAKEFEGFVFDEKVDISIPGGLKLTETSKRGRPTKTIVKEVVMAGEDVIQ